MLPLPPRNKHIGWLKDLKLGTFTLGSVLRSAKYKVDCQDYHFHFDFFLPPLHELLAINSSCFVERKQTRGLGINTAPFRVTSTEMEFAVAETEQSHEIWIRRESRYLVFNDFQGNSFTSSH